MVYALIEDCFYNKLENVRVKPEKKKKKKDRWTWIMQQMLRKNVFNAKPKVANKYAALRTNMKL